MEKKVKKRAAVRPTKKVVQNHKKPKNAKVVKKKAKVVETNQNKFKKAVMKPLQWGKERISDTCAQKRSVSRGQNSTNGEKKPSKRTIVLASVAVGLALIVSAIGVWIAVVKHETPQEPAEVVVVEEPEEEPEPEEPELPTVNTDSLVAEPTINDANAYQVAAYKPRFLTIPSAGLYNVPITEVGMLAGNQLGAPTSIRVVGWYYRSALPGQAGASVMTGHGGNLGNGIFRTLPQAPVGAEIIIEMGDGRKVTYVIVENVYRKIGTPADSYMNTVYRTVPDGRPTLTLITCTGAWIRAQQTYDTRLFVRAVLK